MSESLAFVLRCASELREVPAVMTLVWGYELWWWEIRASQLKKGLRAVDNAQSKKQNQGI